MVHDAITDNESDGDTRLFLFGEQEEQAHGMDSGEKRAVDSGTDESSKRPKLEIGDQTVEEGLSAPWTVTTDPVVSSSDAALSDHGDSDSDESILDELSLDGEDAEVVKEARAYLKTEGYRKFIDRYIGETADFNRILDLTKVLGFHPRLLPSDDSEISLATQYLQLAMSRVLSMRRRISSYNTIEQFVETLDKAQNVLVLTGAGISTSLGIPDFRSSQGFYSQLEHLGLSDPQEVFDIDFFREDPSIFYSIAKMILPPDKSYTPLHGFIKLLEDKGKLLRNYTQNIDNLESNAGVSAEKVVQCHGSFANATCVTCGYKTAGENLYPQIRNSEVPLCAKCEKERAKVLAADSYPYAESYGVMKPDITFFGESLPSRFKDCIKEDMNKCDLLICIGTSLKVAPVSDVINLIPENVPQVLINRYGVNHYEFDVSILGFCDPIIVYICDKLGWRINHADVDKLREQKLEIKRVDSGVFELNEQAHSEATEETE